jgi:hypothetical protein
MKINFDKLKIERPTLYAKIAKEVNHEYAGELEFYPDVLGEEIATELKAWQAAPSVHETGCLCEQCFQKSVAENNRNEKERLAAKAAAQRLLQYMREQGLRDNEHNRAKWQEFEAKLPKDVALSPELIDQFISGWRSVLQWDAPTPAPAPEPAPAPRMIQGKNGPEQELPLDATESQMRAASIEQLRDLSKRRGEGRSWLKRGRDVGWFSANINTGRQSQVV